MPEPASVPCMFCGASTMQTATWECNNCWEIRHRLPGLTLMSVRRIIEDMEVDGQPLAAALDDISADQGARVRDA